VMASPDCIRSISLELPPCSTEMLLSASDAADARASAPIVRRMSGRRSDKMALRRGERKDLHGTLKVPCRYELRVEIRFGSACYGSAIAVREFYRKTFSSGRWWWCR
jgi:hypothetical protein